MKNILIEKPALVIEYSDSEERFQGWLVRDTLYHKICAGGMRVQEGLSRQHLCKMAKNMSLKMRVAGIRVDGAKCGINYDPDSPGKSAAMARFLSAIRPYVESCYSMGPDLNVNMGELEKVAQGLGIPSVKMAIAHAQGWDIPYYMDRYATLEKEIDGWTLGGLRAGAGVAAAALTTLRLLEIPYTQATVAIQGFGTLAKAAAIRLVKAGVNIIGLADCVKSVINKQGQTLDMERLLPSYGPLLPEMDYGDSVVVDNREAITEANCDVLIPAAVENTITGEIASRLQVRAVVPGANLAVTQEAEEILYQRGIIVVPDFLAGCGGSLSMEGLFGPPEHPEPSEVLDYIENKMGELVYKVISRSKKEGITPKSYALRYCSEAVFQPNQRPYGSPS